MTSVFRILAKPLWILYIWQRLWCRVCNTENDMSCIWGLIWFLTFCFKIYPTSWMEQLSRHWGDWFHPIFPWWCSVVTEQLKELSQWLEQEHCGTVRPTLIMVCEWLLTAWLWCGVKTYWFHKSIVFDIFSLENRIWMWKEENKKEKREG